VPVTVLQVLQGNRAEQPPGLRSICLRIHRSDALTANNEVSRRVAQSPDERSATS